jgi:hypothetical protein
MGVEKGWRERGGEGQVGEEKKENVDREGYGMLMKTKKETSPPMPTTSASERRRFSRAYEICRRTDKGCGNLDISIFDLSLFFPLLKMLPNRCCSVFRNGSGPAI